MTPQLAGAARLLSIEAAGRWPEARDDYRATLRSMARELRGPAPARERRRRELHALFEAELCALLMCRQEGERGARRDAFNELVSDVAGLAAALDAMADTLPARRPNFVSFFKARLIWLANDVLESEHRRHARRMISVADPYSLASAPLDTRGARRAESRVLARQILAGFADDPVALEVLRGIMDGKTVAAIARRMGLSRQQVYRLLDRVRAWCAWNAQAPTSLSRAQDGALIQLHALGGRAELPGQLASALVWRGLARERASYRDVELTAPGRARARVLAMSEPNGRSR